MPWTCGHACVVMPCSLAEEAACMREHLCRHALRDLYFSTHQHELCMSAHPSKTQTLQQC